MNILALTIFLVVVAIALFLGFCLLMAHGKIKDLEEVDGLNKKINRLEKEK